MSNDIRRNMALFPISTVMKLTDLTARQIRYYEQHELIAPDRTSGNKRLFSLNDVDRLLEIKGLIDKGINMTGIKKVIKPVHKVSEEETRLNDVTVDKQREVSREELFHLVKQQLVTGKKPGQVSLIHGELTSFFKNIK